MVEAGLAFAIIKARWAYTKKYLGISMKELIDLVNLYAQSDKSRAEKIAKCVEHLYYKSLGAMLRPLCATEEYRIARDVIFLETALRDDTNIKKFKPKSRLLSSSDVYKEYRKLEDLDKAQKDLIEEELVVPHRHIPSAVMLARVLAYEARKERFRWFLATLMALLSALLVAIVKLLGDIYDKL